MLGHSRNPLRNIRYFLNQLRLTATVLLVVLLAFLAAGCGDDDDAPATASPTEGAQGSTQPPAATETPPAELEKVSVVTSWFIDASYLPIVVADEKGYFEAEGLDVEIQQGGPDVLGVTLVADGDIDFLYGSSDEVPYAVGNGADLKSVAVTVHRNVHAILVPGDSSIQSIADLEGKTLGAVGGGGLQNWILPDILVDNGVDPATVQIVEVDPGVLTPSLMSGQFDATVDWTVSGFPALKVNDPDARYIAYADIGWDYFAGHGVITSQQMIDERPEVVRAFVRAVLRGLAETARNPEEALEIGAGRYPENFLERDQSALRLELILNGLETPDTQTHGLGYSTDEEWQSLADVEANYGPEEIRLPEALSLNTYYTNEFLPEEPVQP